jgi:hypothetical protein
MLLIKARIAGSEKGQAELSDAPRSGRPTTAVTLALLERADELIRKDRRITTRKLASELSVSKGSVNNVIDALGYTKSVCTLGSTKLNRRSLNYAERGVFRFALPLRG